MMFPRAALGVGEGIGVAVAGGGVGLGKNGLFAPRENSLLGSLGFRRRGESSQSKKPAFKALPARHRRQTSMIRVFIVASLGLRRNFINKN
jgi:hypothetical protein